MIKQYFHFIVIALVFSTTIGFAQKPVVIKLDNPSFEDYPQAAHVPQGWFDCGFASESPPDIQPGGFFQVNKRPFHGITYVGMVVRDNNTWESIGQRLKTPLLKGATYTFSIYASRSELYVSQSKTTNKEMNYTTPVVLRIWGGSGFCTKDEMLEETEPITSGNWTKMSFKFTPKSTHTHFLIEAFYKTPTVFPYNGNLLIDNASDIAPEEKTVAAVKPPPTPKPKPPTTTVKVKPPKPDTSPSLATVKPNDPKQYKPIEEPINDPLVGAKSEKFKEGQIMKIEKLQFLPNSSDIEKESYPQLDQIFNLLVTNPTLVVEIGGHTNTVIEETMAERLSTERARAVAKYLVAKGIDQSRLVTKGYGRNKPIVKENSSAANKINQRVEIKILSTNG
jgi:outer membrane protein OmpA-like peptidoglycan-associated protein